MNKQSLIKSISTDSIGWQGSISQFLEIYQPYFLNNTFNGVEIIPFKPLKKTKKIIDRLLNFGIKNLSFHGQTGGEKYLSFLKKISLYFVNLNLLQPKILLENFSNYPILFHQPFLENNKIINLIIKNPPKKLLIENHQRGIKGLKKTIKTIDLLRKNQVNCFGLIDVYHFVVDKKIKTIIEDWEKNILTIKKYLLLKDKNNQPYFNAIHFPIGTRLNDSLPIDYLSVNQLKFFAKNIIPYINQLTIENQQQYFGLIYPLSLKKIKKRNQIIFSRLKETGIL